MAVATVTEKTVITLELTGEEAQLIAALVGDVDYDASGPGVGALVASIYEALVDDAGVDPYVLNAEDSITLR